MIEIPVWKYSLSVSLCISTLCLYFHMVYFMPSLSVLWKPYQKKKCKSSFVRVMKMFSMLRQGPPLLLLMIAYHLRLHVEVSIYGVLLIFPFMSLPEHRMPKHFGVTVFINQTFFIFFFNKISKPVFSKPVSIDADARTISSFFM